MAVEAVLVEVAAMEVLKEMMARMARVMEVAKVMEVVRGMAKVTERVLAAERICRVFLPTTGT